MSEFKQKVEQFKQTMQEPGFTTPDSNEIQPDNDATSVNVTPITENDAEISHQDVSEDKPKRAHRKRFDYYRNRIDQLTFEKNVREAQNQQLLARVQEQEQLLAEKQAQLEQNEQYRNAYYENNLQTRESAILNELKTAKEEGDLDKEIALSKELAQVTADKSTYNLYKSQQRVQPSQSEYDYDPQINNYYPQQP